MAKFSKMSLRKTLRGFPTYRGVKKEDLQNQTSVLLQAMTLDELYSEILFEILHIIGSDADSNTQEELFQYLKEAFKIDDQKHNELLGAAQSKEAPNILLNVEVVQAKELASKDANGLSDPFCTLFLQSSPIHRYNTSVKAETLSPLWEEHFSLPVESTHEDVLCLEVWDFDPAETVKEKMSKLTDVKGVKGLRKLMKEIAVTASTGKHDNEIIGKVQIPLKSIPSAGFTKWYNLVKKSKAKIQGAVQLKLGFSAEKYPQVAAQEHRHLLRLLMLHELENNKIDPSEWSGELPKTANTILQQHVAQCGLRGSDEALARWVEMVRLHLSQPLSFTLLSKVITDLNPYLLDNSYSDDELRLFWESTKKLLPSTFSFVKKMKKNVNSESNIEQLQAVLVILSEVEKIPQMNGMELFPVSMYGWIEPGNGKNNDIRNALLEAIKISSEDWLQHLMEANGINDELQNKKKAIHFMRADIQRASESYDKMFMSIFKICYSTELFIMYEAKVCEMVEPMVKEVCESLKPIKFREEMITDPEFQPDSLSMGTSLFELYLAVQKFAAVGSSMFPDKEFRVKDFHVWFRPVVAQWLDIAFCKAMQRIYRAVEIDQLVPVDTSVNYSSSAVDTLSIYYQVKVFWKQLAWPDVEGSYSFVAKIIDDICRCSVYYADIMGRKVDKPVNGDSMGNQKFEVTHEWCLAINNIDYVKQSLKPFVSDLGVDEIITGLSEYRDISAAERCKRTFDLVIESTIETVLNKIIDLLETVATKMTPAIKRFLLEGAEIINQGNSHVDRLMQYLDDNLVTLHSQLNSDNFDRIVSIVWEKISIILKEVVENSLERRRPPSFFSNLNKTLEILIGFFKQNEKVAENEMLQKVKHLLFLHGMETDDLIHQYHLERLDEQNTIADAPWGMLTVKIQLNGETLKVEVMNARNLQPHDTNGSCDPYVKIRLLPEGKYGPVAKHKTKTHKKNLFPLFDETFSWNLTKDHTQNENSLVHFIVKDQDFLGMTSEFVGEAFIKFSDIPRSTIEKGLENVPQVHLKLSKPTKTDSEVYKTLDHRQGEKQAKDFIKRIKSKMNSKTIVHSY